MSKFHIWKVVINVGLPWHIQSYPAARPNVDSFLLAATVLKSHETSLWKLGGNRIFRDTCATSKSIVEVCAINAKASPICAINPRLFAWSSPPTSQGIKNQFWMNHLAKSSNIYTVIHFDRTPQETLIEHEFSRLKYASWDLSLTRSCSYLHAIISGLNYAYEDSSCWEWYRVVKMGRVLSGVDHWCHEVQALLPKTMRPTKKEHTDCIFRKTKTETVWFGGLPSVLVNDRNNWATTLVTTLGL